MFTKRLFIIQANWFAQHEGLMPNRHMQAFAHDGWHALFNLGVSLEEERLVLNIESYLTDGFCDSEMETLVIDAIAHVDSDLLMEHMLFVESLPIENIKIYGV
ncbi:MAG: hypothetical protein ACRDBG_14030 [Waterburya sp.]